MAREVFREDCYRNFFNWTGGPARQGFSLVLHCFHWSRTGGFPDTNIVYSHMHIHRIVGDFIAAKPQMYTVVHGKLYSIYQVPMASAAPLFTIFHVNRFLMGRVTHQSLLWLLFWYPVSVMYNILPRLRNGNILYKSKISSLYGWMDGKFNGALQGLTLAPVWPD